jgi:hypothetical protein
MLNWSMESGKSAAPGVFAAAKGDLLSSKLEALELKTGLLQTCDFK